MKFKQVPPPSLGYVLIVYHNLSFSLFGAKLGIDFLFSKFKVKNVELIAYSCSIPLELR